MKACVYAGCSRPPPARGKTDTSTASFMPHLLSSFLSKLFSQILSHLWFCKIPSFNFYFFLFVLFFYFLLLAYQYFSPLKSELVTTEKKTILKKLSFEEIVSSFYNIQFEDSIWIFSIRKNVPETKLRKRKLSSKSKPSGDSLLTIKIRCLDNDNSE